MRPVPALVSSLAVLLLLPSAATPASAQEGPLRHVEGLGTLSFPASGAPEARAHFERGVLLLHSFEYSDAAAAFQRAQELDPDFALAYWGEAMTHNHPVWDEQDRDAALAALDRYAPTPAARAARAPTDRERMYLRAVDVLYGEGPKATRDTLYARAMEDLVEAHPGDYEARAFHALSLLGLSRGDRDVPGYMRAGALALDLFEENPGHPGAAHYVIHSFDDPTHAPLGLEAARAYAAIAPDAAHAQHMTTHIFLALGMWEGVVEANERAAAVMDRDLAARGLPPTRCGHYNEWLSYGYQQQGRHGASEELVLGCLEEAREGRRPAGSAVRQRALHLASTGDAHGPVARPPALAAGTDAWVASVLDWSAGFAAAARGEADEASRALRALEERLEGAADPEPYGPVWRGTLRSAVAAAEGDLARAVEEARKAAEHEARLPVDFGPPGSFKPPRELEGEMLLDAGRAEEALSAFRQALGRTPGRARTLLGFARAAAAAGEEGLAAEAYGTLAEVLRAGDPGLPALAEATAWLEDRPGG